MVEVAERVLDVDMAAAVVVAAGLALLLSADMLALVARWPAEAVAAMSVRVWLVPARTRLALASELLRPPLVRLVGGELRHCRDEVVQQKRYFPADKRFRPKFVRPKFQQDADIGTARGRYRQFREYRCCLLDRTFGINAVYLLLEYQFRCPAR